MHACMQRLFASMVLLDSLCFPLAAILHAVFHLPPLEHASPGVTAQHVGAEGINSTPLADVHAPHPHLSVQLPDCTEASASFWIALIAGRRNGYLLEPWHFIHTYMCDNDSRRIGTIEI
jgi:hypothetical protein